MDQKGENGELYLPGPDLLSQILGCPSHHLAGNEDPDDYVQEHVDHAHALAAEDTVQPHPHHGRQGGKGVEAVLFGIDRAAGYVRRYGIKDGAGRCPEAHFLALEVAQVLVNGQARHRRQRHRQLPALGRGAGYLVGVDRVMSGQARIRLQCIPVNGPDDGAGHQNRHDDKNNQGMAKPPQHPAVHQHERKGEDHHGQSDEKVR